MKTRYQTSVKPNSDYMDDRFKVNDKIWSFVECIVPCSGTIIAMHPNYATIEFDGIKGLHDIHYTFLFESQEKLYTQVLDTSKNDMNSIKQKLQLAIEECSSNLNIKDKIAKLYDELNAINEELQTCIEYVSWQVEH